MLELFGNMDIGAFHIPLPLALAAVATIGYLLGRKNRGKPDDALKRSLQDLKLRANGGGGVGKNHVHGPQKPLAA